MDVAGNPIQRVRNDFCTECGSSVGPPIGPPCPVCGSLREPLCSDYGKLVGTEVFFRRRGVHRRGLVIAMADQVATVLDDGGGQHDVPEGRLTLGVGAPDGDRAFGLFTRGLRDAAAALLTTPGRRRSFAQAAVLAGAHEAVRFAGLADLETGWLEMWSHWHSGDLDGALASALALPPDRYPDRVDVLLDTCERWRHDQRRCSAVLSAVERLHEEPVMLLLRFLAGRDRDPRAVVGAFVSRCSAPRTSPFWDDGSNATAVSAAAAVENAEDWEWLRPELGESAALNTLRLLRGGEGQPITSVDGVDVDVLDEAIDRGWLAPSNAPPPQSESSSSTYAWARMDPTALSDAALRTLGQTDELVRREIQRGEQSDQGSTRMLGLLKQLEDGDPRVAGELIPLLDADVRPVALAVARSLSSGSVDRSAIVDRSTWDVMGGLLRALDPVIVDDPLTRSAAAHAHLEAAKDALFTWRWSEALAEARACLQFADDEPISDEAQSICGAAAWMQGDDSTAARWFGAAAAGQATDSLLVNHALVTIDRDPDVAFSSLCRLLVQTDDQLLRGRAACIAARVALGTGCDPELLDDTVVLALRATTVADVPLAEHIASLSLLVEIDPKWVADASNMQDSPHAASLEHRLAVARTGGIAPVIDLLVESATDDTSNELRDECRRASEWLIAQMVDDDFDPCNLFLPLLAMRLTNSGIPLLPRHDVLLTMLATRAFAVAYIGDEEDAVPPELLWLDGLDRADRLAVLASFEDVNSVTEALAQTREAVVMAFCLSWMRHTEELVRQSEQMEEIYRDLRSRLSTESDLDELHRRQRTSGDALKESVTSVLGDISEVKHRCSRVDGIGRADDSEMALREVLALLDRRLHE